jgi:hypothetical protein
MQAFLTKEAFLNISYPFSLLYLRVEPVWATKNVEEDETKKRMVVSLVHSPHPLGLKHILSLL